jgi:POT family proton-dependent oligopeptide transporter
VYCAGHGCLALFDDRPEGFYFGLFLIALGSGGIKSSVAAFVGDQFTAGEKSLMTGVYSVFYWSINIGSFFSYLTIPKILREYGPSAAFATPGILMLVATIVFVLGRRHYREIPPTGHNPHFVLAGGALGPDGAEAVTKGRGLARPRALGASARGRGRNQSRFSSDQDFRLHSVFWMLFDQKSSAWVLQAKSMDLDLGPFRFEPAQLQFINPALVMMLVPFTTVVLYPALDKTRFRLTPLRRMVVGMFMAGLSFVLVALIQVALNGGLRPSVAWQLAPYIALTIAEVLVSVTGLEFAYTQAPREMKGTVQSIWLLTITAGNLVVAVVTRLNVFSGAASFLFYAALVSLAGVGLALVARKHVNVEFFREA